MASNGDDNNKNAGRIITIKDKSNKNLVSNTTADSSSILTTKTYTVKISEYNDDGTIKTITITD